MFSFLKYSSRKTTQGFTLVELLISIAIFAGLSVAMALQYGSTDSAGKLDQAENQVVGAIKEAREKSVAIEEYGGSGSGIFPSYGVRFEKDSSDIILYADCLIDDNGNGTVDSLDDFTYDPSSNNCTSGNADGLVETVSMARGTHIERVETFAGSSAALSKVFIEYVRPLPSVWMTQGNGVMLPYGRLEIEIGVDRSDDTRVVTVYTSGLIEVK